MALTTENLTSITTIVTTAGAASEERLTQIIEATEERLATGIAQGLQRIDNRFEVVDARFDAVDADLKDIKFQLSDTVRRSEYLGTVERVERLERKILG